MSAQHPHLHPADPVPGRFVSLRLPASTPTGTRPADEVVLARLDDDLRPDAVVLARADAALEMRRVGRVTAESVELLPLDAAAPPRVVPRAGDAVVGTVVLRWQRG